MSLTNLTRRDEAFLRDLVLSHPAVKSGWLSPTTGDVTFNFLGIEDPFTVSNQTAFKHICWCYNIDPTAK